MFCACSKPTDFCVFCKDRGDYQHIGELYDCNLTIPENQRMMKEMDGFEVSIRTLGRFRKEHGLTRKYTMVRNQPSL